jgi:hypothetical protein
MAFGDRVDGAIEFGVTFVVVARPVSGGLSLDRLLGGEPEQEEVVRSDLLPDLDVRAVQGADGESTIEVSFMLPVPGTSFPARESALMIARAR